MTTESVGAPPRAASRLKPFQAFVSLGLGIVLLLTMAALGNVALGRTQLSEKFSDLATLVHFVLIFGAIPVAIFQIVLPKGGPLHRVVGYTWCAMMTASALVSFAMHELTGGFSPPHAFSIMTLVAVPLIIFFARTGRTKTHRNLVLWLNLLVIVAGLFAFKGAGERALATMFWVAGN